MKIRSALIATFLGASLAFTPAYAADDEEKTPLAKVMSEINDTFKILRESAESAEQNAANAGHVARLIEIAQSTKDLKPAWTAGQPEGEQAEFVAKFHEDMEKLVAILQRLEAAFKAGDNAAAVELVGEMRNQQRSSHRVFRKPRDA